MAAGNGGILPIPTWLPTDEQLRIFVATIEEAARETERSDARDADALSALKAEIARRAMPIKLTEKGIEL